MSEQCGKVAGVSVLADGFEDDALFLGGGVLGLREPPADLLVDVDGVLLGEVEFGEVDALEAYLAIDDGALASAEDDLRFCRGVALEPDAYFILCREEGAAVAGEVSGLGFRLETVGNLNAHFAMRIGSISQAHLRKRAHINYFNYS